jgi:hypothetical protein
MLSESQDAPLMKSQQGSRPRNRGCFLSRRFNAFGIHGDFRFPAIFDFNELRVAKIAQSKPWRDKAPDNLLNCIA